MLYIHYMYHITTHAHVDRNRSTSELIDENIALTIAHQQHYASGNYPNDGQLVIPANKEQWRAFSLDRVKELPVFGDLLSKAVKFTDKRVPGGIWAPATFITKVRPGKTVTDVDMAHLRLSDTVEPLDIKVSEVGVGKADLYPTGRARSLAAVVLCKAFSNGEETITVRSYTRIPALGRDSFFNGADAPDEDVCKDFLQMQRDAMWNTTYEPA
jgi:hypothetical protein